LPNVSAGAGEFRSKLITANYDAALADEVSRDKVSWNPLDT